MKVAQVNFLNNTRLGSRIVKMWTEESCPKTSMTFHAPSLCFVFKQDKYNTRIIPLHAVESWDIEGIWEFETPVSVEPMKRGPGRPKKTK